MKTYSQKPSEITRKWYVLDAAAAPVGRVSTVAARLLIGKDKPSFTPHMDGGDFVIIINADKLVVTGGKEEKKMYYRHSGYPGGITKQSLSDVMKVDSSRVIKKAVRGMLPVNKLRDGRLARLKIYPAEQHNHSAQTPVAYEFKERK